MNENIGAERQTRIAIKDDGQSTDHREVNFVSGEGGQQFFEPGSSLFRIWRGFHARAFLERPTNPQDARAVRPWWADARPLCKQVAAWVRSALSSRPT